MCGQSVEARTILILARHGQALIEQIRSLAPAVAVFTRQDLEKDPSLLSRVLGNMLRNALEACPAGGTVAVGVAPARSGVSSVPPLLAT